MNNEELNTQTYDRAWGAPVGAIRIPDPLWFDLKDEIGEGELLEIGAGVKPAIPIAGSHFIDISKEGVIRLNKRGGVGVVGSILKTDYTEKQFKSIFALEIFEHVEDDVAGFKEVHRILADDGLFVMSTPVFMSSWTPWDEMSSHVRRYETDELKKKLEQAGFKILKYKTRRSIAKKWSVPFPIWFNTYFPNTAMFIAQYFVFYPARAIGRFSKINWVNSPDLKITPSSAGVTIVAKKQ